MRRLRKSVMPAITESSTAPVRIAVFKPAPNRVLSAALPIPSHVVEKTSSYAQLKNTFGEIFGPRGAQKRPNARIFTHTCIEVNEPMGSDAR
jgi:hypothetical protein